MGYSEVHCTLCGVSVNLCRIRTPNEPREYAWNYHGSSKPGTTFIAVDDSCDFENGCSSADRDYPGQKGCMVVFREDQALQSRGRRGRMRRGGDRDKTWDELVFSGLEGERVDLEEEEDDEDWVPGKDAEELDVEEMKYEFGSVSEGCEEDTEMVDQEDYEDESGSATDDLSEYRAWTDKVQASAHLNIYSYPPNSTDLEKLREFEKMRCLAEEFRVKVPTEVRLPLHVSLESLGEPLRSEIGEGKHEEYTSTQDDKKVVSPTLNHPLNALGPEDECWEHLAGPECGSTRGYHGSRISAEEILNCNVAQGILARDINTSWETESTDEDWEGKGKPGWYLTGLVDCMSSRDDGGSNPYPDRHPDRIQHYFMMDDICWDHGGKETMAIAFHPTCLEVFKRVSLKRYGRFDIHALGNWWRESADYQYMNRFPRASEVTEGEAQWWEHNIGAEYLAANPCFVPALRSLLESSRKVEEARSRTGQGVFSILPVEIQSSIMMCLDTVDVASLSIACPGLQVVAEGVLRNTLLEDMPHLWELWCDMPYSRWTKTTAAEIRAGAEAFNKQENAVARVLHILEEEGYHNERAEYKQYWDENREERKKEYRTWSQQKPAGFIGIEKCDLAELVLRLNRARTNGELKGLMNRERIWTDCEVILDRIKELQEEGKIPPSL